MEYKAIWIIGFFVVVGIVYYLYRLRADAKLEDAAEAAALVALEVAEQEKISKEAARKLALAVKEVVKSHHKAHKPGVKRQY